MLIAALEETTRANDAMKDEITQLKVNNDAIKVKITQLKINNDAMNDEIKQLKINDDAMKDEITQLKANNDTMEDENEHLMTVLQKIAVDNDSQVRKINSQSNKIAQLVENLKVSYQSGIT